MNPNEHEAWLTDWKAGQEERNKGTRGETGETKYAKARLNLCASIYLFERTSALTLSTEPKGSSFEDEVHQWLKSWL